MGNALSLALSVGGPIAIGAGIGISIAPEIKKWYPSLKKPSWNPPNRLFGPVWTVLYGTMGLAAHRVWKAGGGPLPLSLYATQLALNFVWSPLFFKAHNLKAASFEITVLNGVIAATIYEFSKVDTLAAQLLLPYLGWSCFATALTYNIWLNNPSTDSKAEKRAAQAGRGGEGGAPATMGEALAGAASEATAKAAEVFLAQGGESQGDTAPAEVAAATAARTSAAAKED